MMQLNDLIQILLIIFWKRITAMSITEHNIKLLDVHEDHQESFYHDRDQDADIPPTQLSGDQNAEQSVFASAIEANKSNFLLTVTTIIKTVIGSGILALPFTVSKLGYVFAIIVFLIATFFTQISSTLLLNAKNMSGHSNYASILYHIYRHKLSKGIGSILIFLNNVGICIAEIIIFKMSIHHILGNVLPQSQQYLLEEWYLRKQIIVLIIVVLEIPFVMVKKIQKLKFMAFLGVAGILIFMTAFIIHYFIAISDQVNTLIPQSQMKLFPDDWFGAIAAIPNIFLALSYQMNFFPVFKGMRNASDRKMELASLAGVATCSVSYLLVGILGYSLFVKNLLIGQTVSANFLQSLPYGSEFINPELYFIINIGFLVSIFFAFPIMFFGCRNNFIALMKLILLKNQQNKSKKWRQNSDNIEQISSYIQSQDRTFKKKKANQLFLIYTFCIYLIIVGVGIGVDDIESVFNIVGAICSTSIGILLPCFFYFMLVSKKNKRKTFKFYATWIIFIIMTPYALFSVISKYIQ